jgi:hypothetical protein
MMNAKSSDANNNSQNGTVTMQGDYATLRYDGGLHIPEKQSGMQLQTQKNWSLGSIPKQSSMDATAAPLTLSIRYQHSIQRDAS